MTDPQWWHQHYRERITNIIGRGKSCSPSAIKRELGSGNDITMIDAVIEELIRDGVLLKSGRRYLPGSLQEKPKPSPTLRQIVTAEFEAKSALEMAAIKNAGTLKQKASQAAEKRRQRRTDQMMKRLKRP